MEHISTHLGDRLTETGEKTHSIRKIASGGWYWISKKILRGHARSLGPAGIAVYNVLAFFANTQTQSCFPSHSTIGKIAGISKRTVGQKLQLLEREGLIRREKQKNQTICYLLE